MNFDVSERVARSMWEVYARQLKGPTWREAELSLKTTFRVMAWRAFRELQEAGYIDRGLVRAEDS